MLNEKEIPSYEELKKAKNLLVHMKRFEPLTDVGRECVQIAIDTMEARLSGELCQGATVDEIANAILKLEEGATCKQRPCKTCAHAIAKHLLGRIPKQEGITECQECGGSGVTKVKNAKGYESTCEKCYGMGKLPKQEGMTEDVQLKLITCPECEHTWKIGVFCDTSKLPKQETAEQMSEVELDKILPKEISWIEIYEKQPKMESGLDFNTEVAEGYEKGYSDALDDCKQALLGKIRKV